MLAGSLFIFLLGAVIFSFFYNLKETAKIKKLREGFISSITHDLKIPVSAIMASAEMLSEGRVKGAKQQEYYNIISSEAKRLNIFIDKILDFSRERKGSYPYLPEKQSILPIIKTAIAGYRSETPSRDLNITLDPTGDLPDVKIDKDAFFHVMINLLNNADKYSRGNKNISVACFAQTNKIILTVRDNGIGIPKKAFDKIFTRFYRVNNSFVLGQQGVGIGLSFVKSIVEEFGGTVSVASTAGKGSTFTIELPTADPET